MTRKYPNDLPRNRPLWKCSVKVQREDGTEFWASSIPMTKERAHAEARQYTMEGIEATVSEDLKAVADYLNAKRDTKIRSH